MSQDINAFFCCSLLWAGNGMAHLSQYARKLCRFELHGEMNFPCQWTIVYAMAGEKLNVFQRARISRKIT